MSEKCKAFLEDLGGFTYEKCDEKLVFKVVYIYSEMSLKLATFRLEPLIT